MPCKTPRSHYKKKRNGFYGESPQEKNRTTDCGCGYKENNTAASLSIYIFHPILVTFTSIFLLKMLLKTTIMLAKKQRTLCQPMTRCKRTLYHQQRQMKINLVLLDDTVNGYFTWKNQQLNHLLHVVTLKRANSFIQMS